MKNKILIADDDVELNEEVREILEDEGFAVVSVFNGQDAVKTAKKGDFDIVILDYKMPGMNGLEAIKSIKKNNPGIRVILISGKPFIEKLTDEKEFSDMCFRVFSKPFDIEEFLSAVKEK